MNTRRNFREFWSIISYRDLSEKAVKQDTISKSITCILFALIAFILTLLNIKSHFSIMTLSTGILTLGMIAAAILYSLKKRVVATILVAIMGIITFSYYAITGANDGFAILWIMMVPLICMYWMGFKIGFFVSFYFQLLLIILFYTGLRENMGEHYTQIFMTRFPILYFGTFMVSTWIIYQTLKSKQMSDVVGRTDALTKIDNRLGFNLKLSTLWQNGPIPILNIFVFDINRLKYINDEYGHDAGDEIIIAGVNTINNAFPDYDIFARMGGDEFCLIVLGEMSDAEEKISLVNKKTAEWRGKKAPFLSLSSGYAYGENIKEVDFQKLLTLADKNMYEAKSQFYSDNSIDRRKK